MELLRNKLASDADSIQSAWDQCLEREDILVFAISRSIICLIKRSACSRVSNRSSRTLMIVSTSPAGQTSQMAIARAIYDARLATNLSGL